MTTAIVLKPDFTATFGRGVLRLVGTFLGLATATFLFHLYHPSPAAQILFIGIWTFAPRAFGPANYGILATAVTGLVVLLTGLSGAAESEVIAERGFDTLLGGGLALLAYWAWPTWERTQVRSVLAGMLDAYRLYFQKVRESYLEPDIAPGVDLEQARQAARVARTNAAASIDRYASEPGTSPEMLAALSGLLASSHRFVSATMALEADLTRTEPVPARDAFRSFGDQVELTLHYLAAALRGSSLRRGQLPDLRDRHTALVRSGNPRIARYALVNLEADRIANSLNTIAEEVTHLKELGPVRANLKILPQTADK